MKTCPRCRKAFDDTQNFCLDDGSPLVRDEPDTLVLPGPPNIDDDYPTHLAQGSPQSIGGPVPTAKAGTPAWIFPVIGVLCGLLVIFGFLAFWKPSTQVNSSDKATEMGTEKPVATSPVAPPLMVPSAPSANPSAPVSGSVVVDSPRDGYLALKDRPCIAPCGRTLYKIPHGTRLILNQCQDRVDVADNRRGYWCLTTFAGYSGWIFDGFVVR